ncbi:DUF6509 family protein [Bacillus sp. FSL K6-3431]|uniref:DUF6509 family protein n=1 Tax=Bacillus sp. FSL K6-3431 TaxID=2921500 RepID=UPI0030F69367
MKITSHSREKLHDPTGILTGERYEFFINIELPEDDEAFTEGGLLLRVIFAVNENQSRVSQYHFIEPSTNNILDFSLSEEEEEMITEYCKENIE